MEKSVKSVINIQRILIRFTLMEIACNQYCSIDSCDYVDYIGCEVTWRLRKLIWSVCLGSYSCHNFRIYFNSRCNAKCWRGNSYAHPFQLAILLLNYLSLLNGQWLSKTKKAVKNEFWAGKWYKKVRLSSKLTFWVVI